VGCIGGEFKFHLIRLSEVCSPISERGLGVWNLLVFNQALFGKMVIVLRL
jgi:hypothetical protein